MGMRRIDQHDGPSHLARLGAWRHGNRPARATTPPGELARLATGEALDAALIFLRATPVFEAAEGEPEWQARHIFVATGYRRLDGVLIRFYVVNKGAVGAERE